MFDLIIDKEFKELIPSLTDEEFNQLEENILRDGIQDPLKVWQGILIDGHNRYKIARKHGLDFQITPIELDSRDDVKIWIIKNQLGRRNLPVPVRINLALLAEPLIAEQAKKRMLATQNNNIAKELREKQQTPAEDICPQLTEDNETKNRDSNSERKNKTNYKLAEMAGVSDKTIQRYKKIKQSAPKEIIQQVDSGELSINAGYNKVKQAERKQDIQRQIEQIEQKAIEKPDGLFDVIAIDPPWGYVKQSHHGSFDLYGRRCTNPYPEMTQAELKALDIPAADNCVMFLWTTHQFIWDAKDLLDTWGFKYRCMIVWNKQQMGTGNLIRMQCEFCLIGLKGNPVFKDVHDIRDIIEEPRREHSRKPDSFYKFVDSLCAGRKLDYFSREKREGWESYGNDTEKFRVAD